MNRRAVVIAIALSIASFRGASAHHLAEDVGVLGLAPRTQAQIEVTAGGFELGDERGDWQVLAVSAERTLARRFSIAARVPAARVRFDDGHTEEGMGDAEFGVRALVRTADGRGTRLACGTGLELPTGDSDRRIGGGHVEWGSYLAGSWHSAGSIVLSSVLSHQLSFEGDSENASGDQMAGKSPPGLATAHDPTDSGGETRTHGSVIEPHTDHEIVASVAATRLAEPFFVSLGVEHVAAFAAPDDPTSLLVESGLLLPGHRRVLTAGIEVPVGGEHRISWRLRGGLRWAL